MCVIHSDSDSEMVIVAVHTTQPRLRFALRLLQCWRLFFWEGVLFLFHSYFLHDLILPYSLLLLLLLSRLLDWLTTYATMLPSFLFPHTHQTHNA